MEGLTALAVATDRTSQDHREHTEKVHHEDNANGAVLGKPPPRGPIIPYQDEVGRPHQHRLQESDSEHPAAYTRVAVHTSKDRQAGTKKRPRHERDTDMADAVP